MRLAYLDRAAYRRKNNPDFVAALRQQFGDFYLLPEGGSNDLGARGCAEIPKEIDPDFDVICCPCGTGGTLAGIAARISPPITGPAAVATPTMAPRNPNAWPRSAPPNNSWISPEFWGSSMPPATPWRSRAAVSSPVVGAAPDRALVARKADRAKRNIRRRPQGVAQPAGRHQREGESVAGHDPLDAGGRGAQVAFDRWQGHVDDADVQQGHEGRDQADRQRPPPSGQRRSLADQAVGRGPTDRMVLVVRCRGHGARFVHRAARVCPASGHR
jgi:hypothetical protein